MDTASGHADPHQAVGRKPDWWVTDPCATLLFGRSAVCCQASVCLQAKSARQSHSGGAAFVVHQLVKILIWLVTVAGTLPASWGSNLTSLVTLDLSANSLSSSLPSGTQIPSSAIDSHLVFVDQAAICQSCASQHVLPAEQTQSRASMHLQPATRHLQLLLPLCSFPHFAVLQHGAVRAHSRSCRTSPSTTMPSMGRCPAGARTRAPSKTFRR